MTRLSIHAHTYTRVHARVKHSRAQTNAYQSQSVVSNNFVKRFIDNEYDIVIVHLRMQGLATDWCEWGATSPDISLR